MTTTTTWTIEFPLPKGQPLLKESEVRFESPWVMREGCNPSKVVLHERIGDHHYHRYAVHTAHFREGEWHLAQGSYHHDLNTAHMEWEQRARTL